MPLTTEQIAARWHCHTQTVLRLSGDSRQSGANLVIGEDMKTLILVAALVILTGCTTARPMYSAPGEQRFSVQCAPAFPQQCRERAAKECGGAYDIIAERAGGYNQQRSLIVQCR